MKRALVIGFLVAMRAVCFAADSPSDSSAPDRDRVGFPEGYQQKFQILRSINRPEKGQIVTIYGNELASSVQHTNGLPYPNGSVIVMETAEAQKGADAKPLADKKGLFRKGAVAGLHVMRRGKGFGKEYGKNQSGDWEYVEYRADKSYITPPQKSFTCSACHIKAGVEKDFVYGGRFAAPAK